MKGVAFSVTPFLSSLLPQRFKHLVDTFLLLLHKQSKLRSCKCKFFN